MCYCVHDLNARLNINYIHEARDEQLTTMPELIKFSGTFVSRRPHDNELSEELLAKVTKMRCAVKVDFSQIIDVGMSLHKNPILTFDSKLGNL
mmetsp:Transcript_21942/g.25237  ORF Transcript_21942/g.25237 Transcript_21942/m.25237 type:complete len:93 (+) Transcript_21942:91-369(+)